MFQADPLRQPGEVVVGMTACWPCQISCHSLPRTRPACPRPRCGGRLGSPGGRTWRPRYTPSRLQGRSRPSFSQKGQLTADLEGAKCNSQQSPCLSTLRNLSWKKESRLTFARRPGCPAGKGVRRRWQGAWRPRITI